MHKRELITGVDYVEPTAENLNAQYLTDKALPIKAARRIAEKYGFHQVVIVARCVGDDGLEHVTTYGVDDKHCEVAAKMGNFFKYKLMGWPEGGADSEL